MQVYLVLWSEGNDGKRLIIGTKRWLNDFWQRQTHGGYKAQNQSGQYSLNGGRVNKGENSETAAKREFNEETGISADTITTAKELYKGKGYAVVAAELDQAKLDICCTDMNENVAPNEKDLDCPAGAGVEDWEFEGFKIVKVEDALDFLGKSQKVPDEWTVGALKFPKSCIENKIADLKRRNPYSQSIDWFGDIAKALQSKLG